MPELKLTDKTSLAYWFPLIEAAGLPVPRTKILAMPVAAQASIWALFDGGDDGAETLIAFGKELDSAAEEFGRPFFLRTAHTSNKHHWKKSCFVGPDDPVLPHVCEIVEFSECAGFPGMPWETWCVREMLPTVPLGTCPLYGEMPVCREFRFFVDEGKVVCGHPYWPEEALQRGGCSDPAVYRALCEAENRVELEALAAAAGRAVGGAWSIDILETRKGWYVTDMAEASKSFHWEGCQNESRWQRPDAP